MKITNRHNLPQALVNFVENESKEHTFVENRFSVTELLGPAKQIVLERRYRDILEQDISDIIPALFGTAVHSLLEKNKDEDDEVEVKMEYQTGNFVIVGRCDAINKNKKLIKDWKTCSTSKIIKNDFEDWRLQGLLYAYIQYYQYNVEIRHLEFYALMKDWSKIQANTRAGYPQSPLYTWTYDIKDSDFDEIGEWLFKKLKDITEYKDEECTEEDRWYTGTKYAVFKNKDDKKATIVCDSEIEAKGYIENKLAGNGEIVIRKGDNLKCMYYCKLKGVCNQWKTLD